MERKRKAFGKRKIVANGLEIVMRPVKMGDAKRLNEIANGKIENRFLMVERPVSLKSTKEHIKAQLKRKLYVVVEINGKIVGDISLRPGIGRRDVGCGFGIVFEKSVHGKGVALAAMKECLRWMKENGFRFCTSEVIDRNARARRFYKKLGFREVAHVPNAVRTDDGKLSGEYIIQKRL